MNCPFRHDIECNDCALYMEHIETHKGYYSSCAFIEIAERLKQLVQVEEK